MRTKKHQTAPSKTFLLKLPSNNCLLIESSLISKCEKQCTKKLLNQTWTVTRTSFPSSSSSNVLRISAPSSSSGSLRSFCKIKKNQQTKTKTKQKQKAYKPLFLHYPPSKSKIHPRQYRATGIPVSTNL
jgi:hypothetical protein